MHAQELAPQALVDQYLHVVNRALDENREAFPWDQLLSAADKVLGDRSIAVGLYKDDPRQPHHWFTVSFDDARFKVEAQGKDDADLKWFARLAHLEEVVEEPDTYIESPVKLDLDWLKKAAGIGD